MITTAEQIQTPDLANLCRWPDEWPRFVEREVEAGTKLRELLEKPQKWNTEFARFLAGVNVGVMNDMTARKMPKAKPISEWLSDEIGATINRDSGGTMERPVDFREVQFHNADDEIISQAVGDFTNYDDTDFDQPELVTGAKYPFRVLCGGALSVAGRPGRVHNDQAWIDAEATAFPEMKHGLRVVVFELEACR
jgi:hypothetical protein